MNGRKLKRNLSLFLSHIDSIRDTIPMSVLLLQPYQKKAKEKLEDFIKTNVKEIEIEDGKKAIAVPYELTRVFDKLTKNSETSILAYKIIAESLFVGLVSQYDAFLNRLLKILFKIRPEYINNSDRELTFSQLVQFSSLDDAREYIVEKEIETVLRKNHTEHFSYLESKLSMPLRKGLPIWPIFIELTERRNLFVHCDGVVSNQYLRVCRENGVDISDVEHGKRLDITPEYIEQAYECLYELSVKLTHTIWRKLLKGDLRNADIELNNLCFDLINSGQFRLSDILLEFACSQKKYHNDAIKNIFIVNMALSFHLQGEKGKAENIISAKDWSASSDDFKLAHLILTENYEEAYDLMRKIGNSGEVEKVNYKTWPLFAKLREEEQFGDVFKEIFEEEYTVLEIPKRPIQELIEEFIKDNPELKERTKTKKSKKKRKKKKRKNK